MKSQKITWKSCEIARNLTELHRNHLEITWRSREVKEITRINLTTYSLIIILTFNYCVNLTERNKLNQRYEGRMRVTLLFILYHGLHCHQIKKIKS